MVADALFLIINKLYSFFVENLEVFVFIFKNYENLVIFMSIF